MYHGLAEAMMWLHVAEAQRGSRYRDPWPRRRLVRSGSWAQRHSHLLRWLGEQLVTVGQRLEAYARSQSLSLEGGTTGSR
jgi:hypothetical protein